MTRIVTSSLHWLGRHAVPAVAVTLIAGAAAGGGIAYATTASHTSPSPYSKSLAPATRTTPPNRAPGASLVRTVVALVVKDTGMKIADIRADLAKGESLDQVAGADATKLENDIVTAIATRLSKHLPATSTATVSTLESKIRARVHQVMAEPGTQLLQQLNARMAAGGAPRGPRSTNPRHPFTPRTSPSPAAAA